MHPLGVVAVSVQLLRADHGVSYAKLLGGKVYSSAAPRSRLAAVPDSEPAGVDRTQLGYTVPQLGTPAVRGETEGSEVPVLV